MRGVKCGTELILTFKNIFIMNGLLVVKCENCETTHAEIELKDIEKIYWEDTNE